MKTPSPPVLPTKSAARVGVGVALGGRTVVAVGVVAGNWATGRAVGVFSAEGDDEQAKRKGARRATTMAMASRMPAPPEI
jgi:hypothetical protein